MSNTRYWLGFNQVNGIGPNRLRGLWAYFGRDMEAAWHADSQELTYAGLDERSLQNLLKHRDQVDLDHELRKIENIGAWICTLDDERYPLLLTKIDTAPPLLYVKGDLSPSDERALAMVGTRKASGYGLKVAERMATRLGQVGVTIVSGLARGLDTQAHRGALASGGRTIAVLGNGIDSVYPSENRALADEIVDNDQGALISEYPPNTPPNAQHFPARNRIISGLSLGVLVVEAPEKSGSLLTAGYAAEQGREVFAIPGNINAPNSVGTNRLIQDGAKLVMHPDDILDELDISFQHVQTAAAVEHVAPTTDEESIILEIIDREPLHVDEIALQMGSEVHEISATLLMMKLKGLVDEPTPMMYMAIHS